MFFMVMLLAATAAPVPAPAAGNVTTVILVRHAEKAPPASDAPDNPPLSAAGLARAKELARVLADANVQTIFVTHFGRTHQTAEPLAKARGITPIEVHTGEAYGRTVVDRILKEHAGETVLVVGQNTTTVDVIAKLGIANPPPVLPESQFDDLFIVTIANGKASLVKLRYGAPSR